MKEKAKIMEKQNYNIEISKDITYYDEEWVNRLRGKERREQWIAFLDVVDLWVDEVCCFPEADLLNVINELQDHVKDLSKKRMLTNVHGEYFKNTTSSNNQEAYLNFSEDVLKTHGLNLTFADIDYLRKRVAELEVDLSLRRDERK